MQTKKKSGRRGTTPESKSRRTGLRGICHFDRPVAVTLTNFFFVILPSLVGRGDREPDRTGKRTKKSRFFRGNLMIDAHILPGETCRCGLARRLLYWMDGVSKTATPDSESGAE